MSIEKLREYFEIFTACWKFFRKYVELIGKVDFQNLRGQGKFDGDTYWEALMNESTEIYEKYGKAEFVKGILVAATKEIERIYEREKDKYETFDKG